MHKPETSLKVRFAVSATAGEFAVKVFELAMNWQSWPYSEIHKFWLRLFTQMTQRQAYCLQPHRSDVSSRFQDRQSDYTAVLSLASVRSFESIAMNAVDGEPSARE